jgi:hypothetical protein
MQNALLIQTQSSLGSRGKAGNILWRSTWSNRQKTFCNYITQEIYPLTQRCVLYNLSAVFLYVRNRNCEHLFLRWHNMSYWIRIHYLMFVLYFLHITSTFLWQDYTSLIHISSICKVEVPKEVLDIIEPIKDNQEAVRKFGVHLAVKMVSHLFSHNYSHGAHFFTLNR